MCGLLLLRRDFNENEACANSLPDSLHGKKSRSGIGGGGLGSFGQKQRREVAQGLLGCGRHGRCRRSNGCGRCGGPCGFGRGCRFELVFGSPGFFRFRKPVLHHGALQSGGVGFVEPETTEDLGRGVKRHRGRGLGVFGRLGRRGGSRLLKRKFGCGGQDETAVQNDRAVLRCGRFNRAIDRFAVDRGEGVRFMSVANGLSSRAGGGKSCERRAFFHRPAVDDENRGVKPIGSGPAPKDCGNPGLQNFGCLLDARFHRGVREGECDGQTRRDEGGQTEDDRRFRGAGEGRFRGCYGERALRSVRHIGRIGRIRAFPGTGAMSGRRFVGRAFEGAAPGLGGGNAACRRLSLRRLGDGILFGSPAGFRNVRGFGHVAGFVAFDFVGRRFRVRRIRRVFRLGTSRATLPGQQRKGKVPEANRLAGFPRVALDRVVLDRAVGVAIGFFVLLLLFRTRTPSGRFRIENRRSFRFKTEAIFDGRRTVHLGTNDIAVSEAFFHQTVGIFVHEGASPFVDRIEVRTTDIHGSRVVRIKRRNARKRFPRTVPGQRRATLPRNRTGKALPRITPLYADDPAPVDVGRAYLYAVDERARALMDEDADRLMEEGFRDRYVVRTEMDGPSPVENCLRLEAETPAILDAEAARRRARTEEEQENEEADRDADGTIEDNAIEGNTREPRKTVRFGHFPFALLPGKRRARGAETKNATNAANAETTSDKIEGNEARDVTEAADVAKARRAPEKDAVAEATQGKTTAGSVPAAEARSCSLESSADEAPAAHGARTGKSSNASDAPDVSNAAQGSFSVAASKASLSRPSKTTVVLGLTALVASGLAIALAFTHPAVEAGVKKATEVLKSRVPAVLGGGAAPDRLHPAILVVDRRAVEERAALARLAATRPGAQAVRDAHEANAFASIDREAIDRAIEATAAENRAIVLDRRLVLAAAPEFALEKTTPSSTSETSEDSETSPAMPLDATPEVLRRLGLDKTDPAALERAVMEHWFPKTKEARGAENELEAATASESAGAAAPAAPVRPTAPAVPAAPEKTLRDLAALLLPEGAEPAPTDSAAGFLSVK